MVVLRKVSFKKKDCIMFFKLQKHLSLQRCCNLGAFWFIYRLAKSETFAEHVNLKFIAQTQWSLVF